MEPEIIYEDKEWAALSKPAGLQMHHARERSSGPLRRGESEASGPKATLADWVLKNYPETRSVGDDPEERPGLVHRLDRDTSGIVLVARSQEYFSYLKSLFGERKIEKSYLALVRGHLKENTGIIDKAIGILSGSTKRSVRSEKMVKSAVTEWRALQRTERDDGDKSSLLEVFPKTGRTHQIRVHLADLGHPIWGDRIYGPKKQPEWVKRLMLHAHSLEFESKPGKRIRLTAAPDAIFESVYISSGGSGLDQFIHSS